jgi:spermidine/putrescine transport system permease protein
VILPNVTLFEQSFRPYLPYVEIGGPADVYSFDNYRTFFDGDPKDDLSGSR